jgi:hypothetical protein
VNDDDLFLDEKVVRLAETFESAQVPYAFGGAIALAYYAEPRATIDVDINVFLTVDEFDRVRALLAPFGIDVSAAQELTVARDGQVRLWWNKTPVDLFFAYDDFHFHAATRVRTVPFGRRSIPVLAAEDLLVCKTIFDRTKDWIDIEQVLVLNGGELDLADVRRWVASIVGPGEARLERWDDTVARMLGA